MEQFNAAVDCEGINTIYFEMSEDFEDNFENVIKRAHDRGIEIFAAFPRIYRERTEELYSDFISKLSNSMADGFLVTSVGQFDSVKSTGKKVVVDYNMNVFNNEAVEYFKHRGADRVTMSVEMNVKELNSAADDDCEMVVYGYLCLLYTSWTSFLLIQINSSSTDHSLRQRYRSARNLQEDLVPAEILR